MKLKRIQKELQALDDMVSADIGILRNRIDQASLDYSYARWVAAAAAKLLQSCPTLCDPIDGSPPGSPIPGILQAKTLE